MVCPIPQGDHKKWNKEKNMNTIDQNARRNRTERIFFKLQQNAEKARETLKLYSVKTR